MDTLGHFSSFFQWAGSTLRASSGWATRSPAAKKNLILVRLRMVFVCSLDSLALKQVLVLSNSVIASVRLSESPLLVSDLVQIAAVG
jgi:hypothetical protein